MAESESVTREEEPDEVPVPFGLPTCPHCGLVANSLEYPQIEKEYQDDESIYGFKEFEQSPSTIWATCLRGHRWKLESRPEPCESHSWVEVTARGDARRLFLCRACGTRETRPWSAPPSARKIWQDPVDGPGSCANAEDLNREPTDKETTLRLASLATLRELLGHLRNAEPAEEEWIEAVAWALREHEEGNT